jgi:SET domain-containing protein
LRFVSPQIGFGVFATRFIPKGTITWVFDPLDQIISPPKESHLPALLRHQLDIYSYQNGRGERILCWDHGRFVNHSCYPTSLAPGLDLEIAIRDIQPGEQITDDYGSLNLEQPFDCACGFPQCRDRIQPR